MRYVKKVKKLIVASITPKSFNYSYLSWKAPVLLMSNESASEKYKLVPLQTPRKSLRGIYRYLY